jgi:hypothetical protein
MIEQIYNNITWLFIGYILGIISGVIIGYSYKGLRDKNKPNIYKNRFKR